MKSGIYKITNTKNGKFYVGSAKDIRQRWNEHRSKLKRNCHDNKKLQHAWNYYNSESFEFSIIEEVENLPDLLFEREQHYLDTLNSCGRETGYNLASVAKGGDNFTNHPNKEEIRKMLRDSNLGYKNPMFGKKHSEESKKKQREKSVGRYTLEWFVERHGEKLGTEKFEERRKMLMNRKINYNNGPPSMSFKGHKHDRVEFQKKYNKTSEYFKNNWDEFVELVKSKKYSQRQLSEMLGISRPTLKVKMELINT